MIEPEKAKAHIQETSEAGLPIWSLTGQGEHMGASPVAPRMSPSLVVPDRYCCLVDSVTAGAERRERTMEGHIADIEAL